MKTVIAKVDDDIKEAMKKAAKARGYGTTESDITRYALEEYLIRYGFLSQRFAPKEDNSARIKEEPQTSSSVLTKFKTLRNQVDDLIHSLEEENENTDKKLVKYKESKRKTN